MGIKRSYKEMLKQVQHDRGERRYDFMKTLYGEKSNNDMGF